MKGNAAHGDGRQPQVVVVGAGPAGLAAAAACLEQGVTTLILERGPDVAGRDRDDPIDIAAGVGGAGLFSDGKFSFYPSATRLWRLRPEQLVRDAYHWYASLLSAHGLAAPSFPLDPTSADYSPTSLSESFSLKAYPSFYMPLKARTQLINMLADACAPALRVPATADRIQMHPLSVDACIDGDISVLSPRALILASGRLGPLMLQRDLHTSMMRFRRLEVGVRIEQDSSQFFLRDGQHLDPKLLGRPTSGIEWRTFCCCRDGEVIVTSVDGINSVSGRADGAPTMRSNIGFHVRVLEAAEADRLWSDLRYRLKAGFIPTTEDIDDFQRGAATESTPLSALFGAKLSSALADGIAALRSSFQPDPFLGAVVHGPCVEGVSQYPAISETKLQFAGCDAWVAGDATGLFRGLTAALVSGYFVGRQAATTAGGEA